MNTLFPIKPPYPPGFGYFPNFITPAEEEALCAHIRSTSLHTFLFQGYEAKRKVASFGWDWNFEKRILTKSKDIPIHFLPLIKRIADQAAIPETEVAELLLTEYPPGSVINWHRDAPPFDLIAGVSLLTDANFRLRPFAKEAQTRKSIVSFTAERQSLYIMQGASRSEWEHSITPVKTLRYSITVRTLKS